LAFERIKDFVGRIRRMLKSNFMQGIAEVAQETSVVSDVMMQAIDLWKMLYEDNPPWLKETHGASLGLPAVIASKYAQSVTLESKITLSGSPMGDYLSEQLNPIRAALRKDVEYACAGGGLVFKPYIGNDNASIVTEIVHAGAFLPTAFDSNGKITGAYFVYRHWEGRKIYSRLEKHELEGTRYSITNKCYVSSVEDSLGKECELTEVPAWAEIEPVVTLEDINAPLFAYFRIPFGNTVDKDSPLGVSVFARAIRHLREADKQFDSLLWEYKGGELAVNANEETFERSGGEPIVPEGKERLFWFNKLDAQTQNGAPLFDTFSPALRDSNYINGLNKIVQQIEDDCFLQRGALTDKYPQNGERTAKEIIYNKQVFYDAVSGIQMSLQTALSDLIYAMYCLAVLYDLAPDGEYDAQFRWDDSIISDAETERMRDQQEVLNGLMAKWEFRMKWYGEDETLAKQRIKEIEGSQQTDEEILGFGEPNAEEGK